MAHAELDQKTGAAGTSLRINVAVPDEEDAPGVVTTKVVVETPEGFAFTACAAPVGWTCTVDEAEGLATFERPREAAVDGDKPELAVDARLATTGGRYPIEVNQFYSSGTLVNWDGPPGSDHPAPVFEVTGSAPEPTTPTTTTVATTTTTAPRRPDEGGDGGQTAVALVIVAVAVVILLAGLLARWFRTR